MLSQPDFWVGVSFVLFIVLLVYLKVPGMAAKALDERADAIQHELDEAKRLREEAQAVLADYERKKIEAEADAEKIIAQAKREAEIYGEEARRKMQEQIERRSRLAEQKIQQAEVAAVKDVRAAAADLAVEAASKVLGAEVKGATASGLIDQSISAVRKQLN
ncbi:F0F1 ATP synthase subunit B family protein [Anderseniella sp. Alg231-50]|uniref:F0F1 ATP synthase subunit B family protein n=1 Tax=Anderseniella sp. Alg231-50 TaxID=1922226 RepID=UPI000D562D54